MQYFHGKTIVYIGPMEDGVFAFHSGGRFHDLMSS